MTITQRKYMLALIEGTPTASVTQVAAAGRAAPFLSSSAGAAALVDRTGEAKVLALPDPAARRTRPLSGSRKKCSGQEDHK